MMTRERINSVIRFCRENFHNDGAEGESVHALCDYIETTIHAEQDARVVGPSTITEGIAITMLGRE